MSCGNCAHSIEEALGKIEGIDSISVSLEKEMASVEFYPEEITPLQLRDAIDDVGYEAELQGEINLLS